MEQYSPSKGSQAFEAQSSTHTKQGICGPDKKQFIIVLVIAIVVGLIIGGIPIGVITTLYINEKSASNSSTSAETSGSSSSGTGGSSNTSSVVLPSQCSSYTTRSEPDRNAAYTSCSGCYCDSSLTTGWYRFTGAAGTRLATVPPSIYNCGTSYPGWFNNSLPSTVGSTVTGTVCVNVNGNLCQIPYSVQTVLATNCDTFYVFFLTQMPYCSTRYCTT